MFQHPLYPWMLADLDYMVELPDGCEGKLARLLSAEDISGA